MAKIEEIDDEGQAAGSSQGKQKMTDEERLALASKLDKELDDFIDGLEKRGYTEGWPEDRWEEVSHSFTHKQVLVNEKLTICLSINRKWTNTHFSWKNHRNRAMSFIQC